VHDNIPSRHITDCVSQRRSRPCACLADCYFFGHGLGLDHPLLNWKSKCLQKYLPQLLPAFGLALPQPLIRAFNWPGISTQVTVDGVVTVVDGRAVHDGQFAHNIAAVDAQRAQDDNLDHETPLSELFEDQIACADMIVVNKSDLLETKQATALVKKRA